MRQSGVVDTKDRKTSEAMPMDFLRKIEKADFPLRVDAFGDINNVLVLQAAGLVEAEHPGGPGVPDERAEVVLVLRITPAGRATLERLRDARPPTEGH